jgi:hypothetical protein
MALRVGLDIDGVLADFRSAFQQAATEAGVDVRAKERDGATTTAFGSREMKRVWGYVKRTPNWWVHVSPYEPAQILRLYELSRRQKWEVVFMTRRPSTSGDPVQFQTQWWLEQQGFFYPAVVTVPGSRGELANALRLDVIVDDQMLNCIDVISGSTAKALLLLRETPDAAVQEQATSRGVGVIGSLDEAIDVLQHLHEGLHERRGRLQRLADWFTTGSKTREASLPTSPEPGRAPLRHE